MQQKYTSKDTSINTVSAVYKHMRYKYATILDYGGGKYDTNNEYMEEHWNSTVVVYDPYNRSKDHNDKVLEYFKNFPARFAVCSNVLNVIKEDQIILEVLCHINSLMDINGLLLIKIYERDKSGIGCETSKGWQRNEKTGLYIPFIQTAFSNKCDIIKKDGILFVRKLGK